jgi:hypothetical protein
MDQRLKAFLVIGTISVIIYVIFLMTSSEKSFVLTASGNRDPTKQKLMVVDQDSGEISFVSKSLQGLNQGVADRETQVSDALKNLLGDNMTNYGGYTKEANGGALAKISQEINEINRKLKTILGNNYSGTASGLTDRHKAYTNHDGNDGILGRLRKRVEDIDSVYWELAGRTIYHGNRIYVYARKDNKNYYLIDDGCDNLYGDNDKASWCYDKAYNAMHIVKVDDGRRAPDAP